MIPAPTRRLLNRAYVYAMRMHGSQTRASGDPYFAHPDRGGRDPHRLPARHGHHRHRPAARRHRGHRSQPRGDRPPVRPGDRRAGGGRHQALASGDHRRPQAPGGEPAQVHPRRLASDVRVLLVKLADRLHNMRTLHFIKSAAKRERIARETLDIYAPLARSIGCHRICTELEELAFSHLNPVARDAIMRRLDTLRAGQGEAVRWPARRSSAEAGRGGHSGQGLRAGEERLFDLAQAAAQIHRLRPALRHLRLPRDRRYRGRLLPRARRHPPRLALRAGAGSRTSSPRPSATTTARCTPPWWARAPCASRCRSAPRPWTGWPSRAWRPTGATRTRPTASTRRPPPPPAGADPLENLRQLVQVLEQGGDAEDLLEHAKLEMFLDQVFVFTPKGKLISLPRGRHAAGFRLRRAHRCRRHLPGRQDQRRASAPAHRAAERRCGGGGARRQGRGAPRLAQPHRHRPRPLGHPPPHPPDRKGGATSAWARPPWSRPSSARARPCAGVSLRPALDRFAAATEADLFEAVGRVRVSPTQVLETVFPGLKETEKAAASERRRIEDGEGARFYVQGGGLAAGRGAPLRPLLQSRARRPHRRHRPGGPRRGRPHHRLRHPGPVRGSRGAVARPAMDPGGRAQHPLRRPPARHHPRWPRRHGPDLHHHRRGRRQHHRRQHAPPPFGLLRRRLRPRGQGRPPPHPHRRRPARLPRRGDRGTGAGARANLSPPPCLFTGEGDHPALLRGGGGGARPRAQRPPPFHPRRDSAIKALS